VPRILVANDDGIFAPGLAVLVEALEGLGELLVCAPDVERSGFGHAITLHTHLRVHEIRPGWHAVSGTPVDCVYFGALHACPTPPDLVVSGINAGYNLGSDVLYSGTVGAAAEGYLRGARALAVSAERGADPRVAAPIVRALAQRLLDDPVRRLWNVNVPPDVNAGVAGDLLPDDVQLAGAVCRITRLGERPYLDRVERREDPYGRSYYWIGGPAGEGDLRAGDDVWAVRHGRVSITPLHLDLTHPDLAGAAAALRRA
jgi:5'-nucleotidase